MHREAGEVVLKIQYNDALMAENEPQREAARVTFGEELRREREIRGISLKEIASATKVSSRFLDALERDDFKKLPAPVFARGFVREYARYLGLDSDEMVDRYIHFTHSIADPDLEEQPEPLHSDRITGEIPRPYARVDRNIWIFLVLLLIFIGAVIAVRAFLTSRAEPAVPPAEAESTGETIEPEEPPAVEPAEGPADPTLDSTADFTIAAMESRYDAARRRGTGASFAIRTDGVESAILPARPPAGLRGPLAGPPRGSLAAA